jgi:glycosyltransferase involved in cell wall biosynthesis
MLNLSVIIPVKDEWMNLRPLHDRLLTALAPLRLSFELLFVDDGSSDGTFELLQEMAATDDRIKVVRLRRNYGQTAALQAGIDWSQGDVLATMDGDLQNDPEDIPRLREKLEEGYDAVLGLRAHRHDNLVIRKLPSWAANWLIRSVTGVQIKDMGCTLRVMRRELAEDLPLYGEMHRFIPVLAQQSGGRLAQIPVRHHPRRAGKTKYGLSRSVRVFLDLITLQFFNSYVTRPMHVMGTAGLLAMGLGVICFLATLWMKYGPIHEPVFLTGNPLLLFGVMLELVGIQFISMGLLGELMCRTYFESQGKTAYLVRTTLNLQAPVKGAELARHERAA